MTAPNVQPDAPDRERRRAADLRTGDRIIPAHLIDPTGVEEVLGVYEYAEPNRNRESWVLVVVRRDERVLSSYYQADERVALADAAEPDLPADVEGVAPGAAIGRATVPEGGA